MKISQMQYFQAVCKYNSISKAAEALYVSQPTISISIRELESEFGTSLFTRVNKQLILTQEGAYFLKKSNEILEQISALTLQMRNMGRHKHIIRLSLLPILGSFLFPEIIENFRNKYPDIEIIIQECGSTQASKNIENDDCDLAMIIADQEKSDQLDGITFLKTEYVYCVNKSHPMAGLEQIDFELLGEQSLMLFKNDTYLTREIKKHFYHLGIVPKILLYAVHLPLIIELLSSGKDGTIQTKETASRLPNIVAIPLVDSISVTYALVWKKNKMLHGDSLKFIDIVKEFYPNTTPYV